MPRTHKEPYVNIRSFDSCGEERYEITLVTPMGRWFCPMREPATQKITARKTASALSKHLHGLEIKESRKGVV